MDSTPVFLFVLSYVLSTTLVALIATLGKLDNANKILTRQRP
jgi:hypothetical protein